MTCSSAEAGCNENVEAGGRSEPWPETTRRCCRWQRRATAAVRGPERKRATAAVMGPERMNNGGDRVAMQRASATRGLDCNWSNNEIGLQLQLEERQRCRDMLAVSSTEEGFEGQLNYQQDWFASRSPRGGKDAEERGQHSTTEKASELQLD